MSISKPNLAQVGDYLNGLPPAPSSIQQLDKWSKGANPEIPGWAAAGALQQKTQEMGQQKNAQGAATGPMPTIIDQLRQKAAMVEQQRQQQAMAQQLQMLQAMQGQQQQGAPGIMGLTQPNPMPATSSGVTPQAASSGVTAAEGGLMQLPVDQHMFNYAQGGVIGFDGTGPSSVPDVAGMTAEKVKEYAKELLEKRAAAAGSAPAPVQGSLSSAGTGGLKKFLGPLAVLAEELFNTSPEDIAILKEAEAKRKGLPSKAQQERDAAIAQVNAAAPEGANLRPTPTDTNFLPPGYARPVDGPGIDSLGLDANKVSAVANNKPAPVKLGGAGNAGGMGGAGPRVAPAGNQAGVASLVQNPHTTQLDAALAKANVAPTTEGTLANERALMPELLNQPYMKEARQRIEAEDARRKEQLKGRGQEHLLDVLNGIAYGGFGAAGIAHRNATQKEQAADAAHNAEINKLLTELDKGERGEAAGKLTSRMTAFGEEKKAFSEAERNKLTSLATVYGVDQRAAEAAAHNLTQLEVARINARAKPGEQMQLLGQYIALKATDPKKAKEFLEGYNELNEVRTGRGPTNMDKAIDNVTNMAKNDFAMQKRFRDNPDAFRQKVQEVYNMMNQVGGGAAAPNPTAGADSGGWSMKPIQ